jgi:hypothetical protein
MSEGKKKIRIGLTLEGELLKRFQAIKRKWCMEANADIIRMLITNEYDRVKKELKD